MKSLRTIKNVSLNISLLIAGSIVSLWALEVVTRETNLWYIPDYRAINWYQPSKLAGLPYVLKPNLNTQWGLGSVTTNAFGLRDSHDISKPNGVFRILAVGDSITFGLGVAQNQSFPAITEELLNQSSTQKYEVINSGVPGYNLVNEAAALPGLVERYRPDLVLWTVYSNDYDDSFGTDSEGRLLFDKVDYVSNSDSLQNWVGHTPATINPYDFRKSMSSEAVAWADGKPVEDSFSDSLSAWLAKRSVLFSLIRNRLLRNNAPAKDDQAISFEAKYRFAGENEEPWLHFAPIYSSRRSRERVNEALERSIQYLATEKIPLILWNTNLPLDSHWRDRVANYTYEDSAAYLLQPFLSFLSQNNLGWDGHLNPQGNRKFATAIVKMLGCSGFVDRSESCEKSNRYLAQAAAAWDTFNNDITSFGKSNYKDIDFEHFRGMQQILGGVFPPRIFPGHLALRANFLLPGQTSDVLLKFEKQAGLPDTKIRFSFFKDSLILIDQRVLKPSDVNLLFKLPDAFTSRETEYPLEMQMECLEAGCGTISLKSIRTQ